MIYTITFNPSLDYIVSAKNFEMGKTNRTTGEQLLAGGKGINVSTVLHNLGIENTALGFVAGFTGKEIVRMTAEMGLVSDFIMLENGFSRINVKMKDFDGTELNGMGPVIDENAMEKLWHQLEDLGEGDILVLAGSISKGMSSSIYGDIMSKLAKQEVAFVVDATGDLLLNVLKYQPFLTRVLLYHQNHHLLLFYIKCHMH